MGNPSYSELDFSAPSRVTAGQLRRACPLDCASHDLVLVLYVHPMDEDDLFIEVPLVRKFCHLIVSIPIRFVQVALDSCRRALRSSVNVFHVT